MNITKAFVGLTVVAAAALTLAPTAGAQEAGALRSLSAACAGESVHMFAAAACGRHVVTEPAYEPGAPIKISLVSDKECATAEAISTGFADKATLTQTLKDGVHLVTGQTKAVTTPGDYQATFRCDGEDVINDRFTIRVLTPPTTTTPPAPGKPKPPVTKPKGAADTGGGGTA